MEHAIQLCGMSAAFTTEHGAVRVVKRNLEVWSPASPLADPYTGNILIPGHLVQIFDEKDGKWRTECPAVDAYFCSPSSMTAEVRAAAEIDRAVITKVTA
mgnify:CR=1 FL=1